MGLPKLETKTYTLTLPSTGKEIKYRPFLMKEQKTMLMAQESEKDNEIVDVMSQLITDCTFSKVDSKTCPLFDAEYIFLKLRSKSVGEKVKVVVTCPDDKETKTEVEIDISEVECHMTDDHSDTVEITDEVKIIFNYPLLTDFTSHSKDISQTDLMFKMINQCIKEIHYGETVYNKVDLSEKDISEFMDSLSTSQFTSISKFFDSMPKLRHVIKVTNPNTKVEGEVLLEGLQSFLV
tara:strand:+ start:786 stop:1493 length:708 start_codon:yes stop_codon:yes gene_type:complete